MKKQIVGVVALLTMVICGMAHAQAPTYSKHVIGGHLDLGMAGMATDVDVDLKPRLAAGLFAYYNHYVTPIVALNAGMGILGKGYRSELSEFGMTFESKLKLRYMALPVGVLFNINELRLGVDLVLTLGLGGELEQTMDGQSSSADIGDSFWDDSRRVNLGTRLSAGYGIEAGPIKIVPGVYFEMHLLNEAKEGDHQYRYINFMVAVGVEYGL